MPIWHRGVELFSDRKSKFSVILEESVHAKINSTAPKNGLLFFPSGGTVDGWRGDQISLAPPDIANRADLQQGVSLIARSIRTMTGG